MTAELVQFAKFVEVFKYEENKSRSKPFYFFGIMHRKDIVVTFPNIEIMLRIYLLMMDTKCSGERSFSKLKMMKTRMGNQRLNHFAILSIEHDIWKQTDFSQLISTSMTRKSSRVYL